MHYHILRNFSCSLLLIIVGSAIDVKTWSIGKFLSVCFLIRELVVPGKRLSFLYSRLVG